MNLNQLLSLGHSDLVDAHDYLLNALSQQTGVFYHKQKVDFKVALGTGHADPIIWQRGRVSNPKNEYVSSFGVLTDNDTAYTGTPLTVSRRMLEGKAWNKDDIEHALLTVADTLLTRFQTLPLGAFVKINAPGRQAENVRGVVGDLRHPADSWPQALFISPDMGWWWEYVNDLVVTRQGGSSD